MNLSRPDLRSRLAEGSRGAGERAHEGVLLGPEECSGLLELIESAEETARAIAPLVTAGRRSKQKWWNVLPELERAHRRLVRALERIPGSKGG